MDFFEIIVITLHVTNVWAKKYASSSDESIENLVYFKDCQHKAKETTVAPVILRSDPEPPPKPECPFPKMCCSLSCGNECGNSQSFSRQMDSNNVLPFQPIQPSPTRQSPIQPPVNRSRKKKAKFQPMQPIPSRRDFGFTKDKIKSLISKDDDIRKILKDLVRVTMKKVDLLDMMTTANVESITKAEVFGNSGDDDYYE